MIHSYGTLTESEATHMVEVIISPKLIIGIVADRKFRHDAATVSFGHFHLTIEQAEEVRKGLDMAIARAKEL